MAKKIHSTIPRATAADLRGRQSVRVSFKLTPRCIDAINILGQHLQLMPKSLFDHLVQEHDTLEAIAAKTKEVDLADGRRTTKTYVISRDAGQILRVIARRFKVPRDDLVEASIRHLMPLIEREQVRHDSRKGLAKKMEAHLEKARNLLDEMVADLGDGDPMCDGMKNVITHYEREFSAIAEFIKKGETIEHFEIGGDL
jgi:hypothetical protein